MLTFIQALQDELHNTKLIPIFEFKVLNLKTKETDYISCDIFFKGKSITCHREGLTLAEQNSKKIASSSVVAYKGVSLDSLLEELYCEVMTSIMDSPLYDLV